MQAQAAVDPDAAADASRAPGFHRLEAHEQRRDGLARLGGDDGHGKDLVGGAASAVPRAAAGLAHDVTHLGNGGQGGKGELRLLTGGQAAHAGGIGWGDDRSPAVEEAVEGGVRGVAAPRADGAARVHVDEVAQLLLHGDVEQVERVVLQRGVDPRVAHQRVAARGDGTRAQFLNVVERRERRLELPLEVVFGGGGGVALGQVDAQGRDGEDDDAHRHEQLPAKPADVARRGVHGRLARSAPLLGTSTGRESVVRLSSHALSV